MWKRCFSTCPPNFMSHWRPSLTCSLSTRPLVPSGRRTVPHRGEGTVSPTSYPLHPVGRDTAIICMCVLCESHPALCQPPILWPDYNSVLEMLKKAGRAAKGGGKTTSFITLWLHLCGLKPGLHKTSYEYEYDFA